MKTKIMLWAAIPVAAVLLVSACSKNVDIPVPEQLEQPEQIQQQPAGLIIHYTAAITGGEDNASSTKATVDADNKTLRFAAGDKLYISGTDIQGVLDIESGVGETSGAVFSGDLTYTGSGTPADDLELLATLVGANNVGVTIEDGRVTGVAYPSAAFCADVFEAVEKYSHLVGVGTYADHSFTLEQQTAFLNFALTFVDGTTEGADLTATVQFGGATLATASVTTVSEAGNVMARFVLPVKGSTSIEPREYVDVYSATVTIGENAPIAFISSFKRFRGQVYNIRRTIGTLTALTENHTFTDGETLSGVLVNDVKISIAANASVTLNNATINTDGDYAGLTCLGDATITLVGTNSVSSSWGGPPGVQAGGIGTTLTIQGGGSLTATGGSLAPGIGAKEAMHCGNITIAGGTIIAQGGDSGAPGIGNSRSDISSCGDITITGGNVTATAGYSDAIDPGGAGIGSSGAGYQTSVSGAPKYACGTIRITGGTVTATGGYYAAGIGAGCSRYSYAGYELSNCQDIIIEGGTVTANGGQFGAGIGSGYYKVSEQRRSKCGSITITGGSVTAKGGLHAVGIGSGKDNGSNNEFPLCGTITISKDITMVKAESYASHYIGSSTNQDDCGAVYIDGQEFTSKDNALSMYDSYPLATFDHLNAVRADNFTLLLTPKN